MGWRPDEVRRATVADLVACFDGWVSAQGGGEQGSKYPTPEERAELAAHRRKMEAKRRVQGVTDGGTVAP